MTVEQLLTDTLRRADDYAPSPDLFAKVQRSIEEDAQHRSRLRTLAVAVAIGVAVVAVFLLLTVDLRAGTVPHWALEVLGVALLVTLTAVLGPAIKRFGQDYEATIFAANPQTGREFLRLLDFAYYLVFAGYIVILIQFQAPSVPDGWTGELAWWIQLQVLRVGGLLMLMGVLHVFTIVVMPIVGLVFTANWRRARRLELGADAPPSPRDLQRLDRIITVVVWVLVSIFVILPLLNVLIALVVMGFGA